MVQIILEERSLLLTSWFLVLILYFYLMKLTANIISSIFHPLFMPVISMGFYLRFFLFVKLHPILNTFILAAMAMCTIIFPLITIFVMKSSKMITSVHMPTKEERRWPLLIGTFFFGLAYMIIGQITSKFSGLDGLKDIAIAGMITLLICTIVNLLYKLSIHMAGIGGFTGMVIAYASQSQVDLLPVLVGAVLVAGLIGFARLQLSAHSSGQVALGYAVGFISQYVILHFFAVRFLLIR